MGQRRHKIYVYAWASISLIWSINVVMNTYRDLRNIAPTVAISSAIIQGIICICVLLPLILLVYKLEDRFTATLAISFTKYLVFISYSSILLAIPLGITQTAVQYFQDLHDFAYSFQILKNSLTILPMLIISFSVLIFLFHLLLGAILKLLAPRTQAA